MITTTWQEAGFPDVTGRDYGVPMFVLANATLEYRYFLSRSSSGRVDYLTSNCIKHLDPNKQSTLWRYDYLSDIITNCWRLVYLAGIGSGAFDFSGVDQNDVIRSWTDTPSGQLLVGQSVGNTPYFLAEAARQSYMILSGSLFVVLSWDAESIDDQTVKITIKDTDVQWAESALTSLQFFIVQYDLSGYGERGNIVQGTTATFHGMTNYKAFVRGIPRNSYWVGKRISN